MPVAIVLSQEGRIPAIFSETSDAALLDALRSVVDAPPLGGVNDAKEWLAQMPEPSGWFDTARLALLHTERLKASARAGGDEVREARSRLGVGRAEFASAIGIGGNSNTQHKFIYEVERGAKDLSAPATRAMRALLAEAELGEDPSA